MKPNPVIQRRQAHRKRLALGRALHQVRALRGMFGRNKRRLPMLAVHLPVPNILRKHARLLRRAYIEPPKGGYGG